MEISSESFIDWGSWVFEQATLKNILEVDRERTYTNIDNYPLISNVLMKTQVQTLHFDSQNIKLNPVDTLNDYLKNTSEVMKNNDEVVFPPCKEARDNIICDPQLPYNPTESDVENLSAKLLLHIKENNITKIVTMASNMKTEDLKQIISAAWKTISEKEEQRSFIRSISCTQSSSRILCSDILLPWVNEHELFHYALDVLTPVLSFMEYNIVEHLILPILNDQNSIFIRDISTFKHFFEALSKDQIHHTLSLFIDICSQTQLQNWQLEALHELIEHSNLNESSITQKLINLLNNVNEEFNSNRYFGKILLKMARELTSFSSIGIVEGLKYLAGNYKGVMRFRIQKELQSFSSN